MLIDLILKNRSYRRFDGTVTVSSDILESLVELARLCPSSRNQQALKFMAVNQAESCDVVFPCLAWAGYLKDWDGPSMEERPSAYIIILGDKDLGSSFDQDLGICAQTILIGAVEKDLGGCMIASIRREQLRSALDIPDSLDVLMVLAIGKPIEIIVIDTVKDGDIRYWRDADQVHHVPKRDLGDILIKSNML